jgi:hypothetical protein
MTFDVVNGKTAYDEIECSLDRTLELIFGSFPNSVISVQQRQLCTGQSEVSESYIDPLHISPAEVPAWTEAEVGKQGVNAHLVFRLEEHKLGFPALQADCIIASDFHNPIRITILRDPIAN